MSGAPGNVIYENSVATSSSITSRGAGNSDDALHSILNLATRSIAQPKQATLAPEEIYFGKTDGIVESLAAGRVVARAERLKANQATSCPACPRAPPASETKEAAASERSQVKEAARSFAL